MTDIKHLSQIEELERVIDCILGESCTRVLFLQLSFSSLFLQFLHLLFSCTLPSRNHHRTMIWGSLSFSLPWVVCWSALISIISSLRIVSFSKEKLLQLKEEGEKSFPCGKETYDAPCESNPVSVTKTDQGRSVVLPREEAWSMEWGQPDHSPGFLIISLPKDRGTNRVCVHFVRVLFIFLFIYLWNLHFLLMVTDDMFDG